ncbi:hypothetical protein [Nostoc sp. FACHB-145]|uniref:hypothetical protein n=1 Tax=Nostoc sp. FACHB-145 TaxID=2692836 RepID=UPI0016820CA0|nr:hypothetical protein [Nostoc sp. FACHB-145]MBD2472205.1 hypothetical protein [Nostoc sp. FACHB-145]
MLNDGIDAEITERFGEQAEIIKLKLKLTAKSEVNALLECFLNKFTNSIIVEIFT